MELQAEASQPDNKRMKMNVVPIEYVDGFETTLNGAEVVDETDDVSYNFNTSTQQSVADSKPSKYYKQTYRSAWENMTDFKGWLTGVSGQPTRAYCLYCQKTLHAHRLSLLKHTCTIRHQKAAQIHQSRQNKTKTGQYVVVNMSSNSGAFKAEEDVGEVEEEEDEEDDDYDTLEEAEDPYAEEIIPSDEHETIELAGEEVYTGDVKYEQQVLRTTTQLTTATTKTPITTNSTIIITPATTHQPQPTPATMATLPGAKPPISTHVLDTSRGQPVAGLQVTLYRLIDGRWTYINEGMTNVDGRCTRLLEAAGEFQVGRYKLHFDVDRYFEGVKVESLYPFIEIVFDCKSEQEHYHIPVLLNPFGYTTYRGS